MQREAVAGMFWLIFLFHGISLYLCFFLPLSLIMYFMGENRGRSGASFWLEKLGCTACTEDERGLTPTSDRSWFRHFLPLCRGLHCSIKHWCLPRSPSLFPKEEMRNKQELIAGGWCRHCRCSGTELKYGYALISSTKPARVEETFGQHSQACDSWGVLCQVWSWTRGPCGSLPAEHIPWSLQTISIALWGEWDALCCPPASLLRSTGKHIGQASLNPGQPHRLPEWISTYQYWTTFCCWKILPASSGFRRMAGGTALGIKRPRAYIHCCHQLSPKPPFPYKVNSVFQATITLCETRGLWKM